MAKRIACFFLVAAPIFAALSGCDDPKRLVIEISPQPGGKFLRQISCLDHSKSTIKPSEFPKNLQDRIQKIYGIAEPKTSYSGVFLEKTPNDAGGAGFLKNYETSLGSVIAYVERLRGVDDIVGHIDEIRSASKDLGAFIEGWLAKELEGDPGLPALREYLREDLPDDLSNVAIYVWLAQARGGNDDWIDAVARIGLYLWERQYFQLDDLPHLSRLSNPDDANSKTIVPLQLKKLLARKMGWTPGEEFPAGLSFLDSDTRAQISFLAYYHSTPEYKKRLGEWEAEETREPEAVFDTTPGVYTRWTEACVQIDWFGGRSLASIEVHADASPVSTNGEWDGEKRVVAWRGVVLPREQNLTRICYAYWALPDEKAQRSKFGKIVISGNDLGTYVFWRLGMTPTEASEWERFLATVKPSSAKDMLAKFRFSREREDKKTSSSMDIRQKIWEQL